MIQFWTLKEIIFVHYCFLQFAYCAVVMTKDFDAMEVCCETVVSCVNSEVCSWLFSRFILVVSPCGLNVLPLFLVGWGNGFLEEFFLCFLFYESLNFFKVGWCLCVLECGSFFFANNEHYMWKPKNYDGVKKVRFPLLLPKHNSVGVWLHSILTTGGRDQSVLPPTAPGQVTTCILRTLALVDPRNWSIICVIAGFRRGVYEILALLGRYAAQIGSYRRFGSRNARTTWLLKTGQIICPVTSRINYQSSCVMPQKSKGLIYSCQESNSDFHSSL